MKFFVPAVLASVLLVTSTHASENNAQQIFDSWLTAFNSGDREKIRDYYRHVLGDPEYYSDFEFDQAEETGGVELVTIEQNDPAHLVALVREKAVPAAQRRVTIDLEPGASGKLKAITLKPLPLPQDQALQAMDMFAERLTATDRFSGVIAIKQNGKVIYQRAFGQANRETGAAASFQTPFFMSSQGKMFTGVSILQLVEAGKIGLNDPLGKYLTDYPDKEMAKVTIKQLLTHSGGTGDIGILGPDDGTNRAKVRTIADVIQLNGNRPPEFTPGSKFEYSNYGFILLGAIIEKASGQSYYDYVEEHVLKPANMRHTSWPTPEQLAGVAVPYTESEDGKLSSALGEYPWRGMSAGGGVSTVGDELAFADALKAGKLISPAMLKEATRQQTDWYGYGFISSGPANFPHWGHGGGAPGSSTVFAVYPTNDMTMVCMANRDGPVCDRLLLNLHFHLAPEQGAK